MKNIRLLVVGTLVLGWVGPAQAGPTATQKCAAAKIKTAGKYAACRLNVDQKAALKALAADYSKCDAKQLADWTKIETKYGLDCPTTGDQVDAQADVSAATNCVAGNLAGTPGDCNLTTAQLCGNGVLDAGEQCDFGALNGQTCATATANAKPFGVLGCAANCTGFDTSGCISCAAGGAVVNGTCWFRGAVGDSCTATCALKGMAYSSQTDTYASATSGTIGHCAFILDALGQPTNGFYNVGYGPNGGIGCWGSSPNVNLDGGPATAQGNDPIIRRVCGCQ